VSPGCAHCYAERIELRFGRSLKPWKPEHAAENVRMHPARLGQPLHWKRPRVVFVNSMSDLFHELVPVSFVQAVFDVMVAAERHTFQVLTKRPERARGIAGELAWPKNVWLGVSIENAKFTWRADVLREITAAVRFISAEPLLGSLFESEKGASKLEDSHPDSMRGWRGPLDLTGIDWLIVGGESGPGARPMQLAWARELRDACRDASIAFFFKQWGGRTPKAGGRELDGRTFDDLPLTAAARL
jgi:protein gp37